MSVKQEVIESLKNLPEDATIDDVEYHIYVVTTLSRRLATPGSKYTVEEAREQLRQWLD